MGCARLPWLVALATIVLVTLGGTAEAAVLAKSSTAPTVDLFDLAQLTGAADIGGDEGHIWSNRPVQGQTFTTLGNPDGYFLNAITLKNFNNTTTGGAFTVRVGTVSGTSFTPVASETTQSGLSYVPGDYLTATFASPVPLAPNTVYGFDWGVSGSGFVTTNNLDSSSNVYAGGTAYSSGANSVPNDAILLLRAGDRVFHLDMTRPMPRPALEYFFNDASGTTVPNHGTLGAAGNATLGTNTTVGNGGQPFLRGGYLVVDQNLDKLSTADLDSLDTLNEFSLSMFAKPTAATLGNWADIVGDCDAAPGNSIRGWQVQSFSDGRLQLRLWADDKSSFASFNSSPGLLAANEWHQIGMTVTGATLPGTHDVTVNFFRDGELFSTHTATGVTKILGNGAEGFKLGNAMWDGELLAQYGGVALFGTALSADEMRQYYNFVMAPEPSSLVMALGFAGMALLVRRRWRGSRQEG